MVQWLLIIPWCGIFCLLFWLLYEISTSPFIKACVCYFYQYFFQQMIVLQKLWKMLFISSKKLFSFSRFLYFHLPLFLSLSATTLEDDLGHHHCLNKDLIIHFVWYLGKEKRYDIETLLIDRVLNKEHLYMKKSCRKCAPKPSNPKQLLHARNSVENKIFWNRIIKKFQKSYTILLSFLTQFLLMEKTIKNKKGLELVTRHSSSYKTNSGKFLYQLHIIWPVLMM